jgi:ketosteroid isomerase-like protein
MRDTELVRRDDALSGGNAAAHRGGITAREAFERGTDTFNAHDIDGFAEVLADDVVYSAPGGARGEGKPACAACWSSWLSALPDAHVEVHDVHVGDDVVTEEGPFSGTHDGVPRAPTGDIPPMGRSVSVDYVHVRRFHDGKPVSFNLMRDRLALLERLGRRN